MEITDNQLVYTLDDNEPVVAGQVMPRWCGDWSKLQSYIVMDMVNYDNALYLCTNDVVVNKGDEGLPPNEETASWRLFLDKSIDQSALDAYEARIAELEAKLEATEEEIKNLTATAIYARIDELYEEINQR